MCYLVRQQQPQFEVGGVAEPPSAPTVRPRWVGGTAVLVFSGLALAGALLTTPSQAPGTHSAKDAGAIVPVAQRATQLPDAGGVERTALPMDDGVPTSTSDVPKAMTGHCHQGL